MKILEINKLDDLNALKDEWNKLLPECPDNNIFLTWEWQFAWFKYFSRNEMKALVFEDNGKIKGIIPLKKFNTFPGIYENPAVSLSDYWGLLVSYNGNSAEEISDLVEQYIAGKKIILRFDQISDDTITYELLAGKKGKRNFLAYQKELCVSPYIRLPVSLDEHLKTLSTKFTKNLRRGEAQLKKEHGPVTYRRSGNHHIDEDLSAFWNLIDVKLENKNLPKFSALNKKFLTEASKNFLDNGWLSLSFLEVGDKPVSAILGFEYASKYYFYQIATDPAYGRYSVGNIHIKYVMEDLINRNVKEFDFLRGDESYKTRWNPLYRKNYRFLIAANGKNNSSLLKFADLLISFKAISNRGLRNNIRLYQDKLKNKKLAKEIDK